MDVESTNARGGADLNFFSLVLADQCPSDGRANGNLTVLRFRLVIAEDLIYPRIARVTIGERHRGTEYNLLAGKLGNVYDLGPRDFVFDLPDLQI